MSSPVGAQGGVCVQQSGQQNIWERLEAVQQDTAGSLAAFMMSRSCVCERPASSNETSSRPGPLTVLLVQDGIFLNKVPKDQNRNHPACLTCLVGSSPFSLGSDDRCQ